MTSVDMGQDFSDASGARRNRMPFGRQLLALALSLSIGSSAMAQSLTTGGVGLSTAGTTSGTSGSLISQIPGGERVAPSSTILPTDVVPLPAAQERTSFGENLQLRVLQRLPASFYFNASVEASVREETNVFQFPTKRKFLTQLPSPAVFRELNPFQQQQVLQTLNLASANDVVFRILPNITWGWALKPRTRLFGNYFMIRDQLTHWTQLNTVIHSIAYGVQQDIPVGRRGNIQLETQFRELYQLHSKPVFDFLPAITFSYVVTPRMVAFVNTLLQLRGRGYFRSPNREIDPFYTFGAYYAKNGWAFSATGTFVQNFREPFRRNATIPVNNYSMIADFEIARRLVRQLPGFQVFARAEPIWNFHSHARPGLTGMDFRMFFGARFQFGKPALTAAYEQIKQQLEEQETTPPPPGKSPGEAKPSAFLMPYQLIAATPQPIHGFLGGAGGDALFPAVAEQSSPSTPEVIPAVATADIAAIAATLPTSSVVEPNAVNPISTDVIKAVGIKQLDVRQVAAPEPAKAKVVSSKPTESGSTAVMVTMPASVDPVEPAVKPIAAQVQAPSVQSESRKQLSMLPAVQEGLLRPDGMQTASDLSGAPLAETVDTSKSKRSIKRKLSDRGDRQTGKSFEVEMVIVPPLPSLKPNSNNPFSESGIELKPPILNAPIH